MAGHPLQVLNATRGSTLVDHGRLASNPWTRFVGLLGRAGLKPGEGLHIQPCASVHTWFMRFPIDVVYLDHDRRVVKTIPALRTFRFSWGGPASRSVLELPAGTIRATRTLAGDQVTFAEK